MNLKELEDQVRALMAQGRKVEAVKRVLETTGWGLKESKDYVDALARSALPVMSPEDKAALEQEARALIQQERSVEAIKLVREWTGWGLGECKAYVDALIRGNKSDVPLDWVSIASSVGDLVALGRHGDAIEWVMNQTKMNAREAQDYVDFIVRSARFPSDSQDLPAQAISQVRDLLSQDRRIQAIKLVRVLTRWGLRESKDYVDSLMPR